MDSGLPTITYIIFYYLHHLEYINYAMVGDPLLHISCTMTQMTNSTAL